MSGSIPCRDQVETKYEPLFLLSLWTRRAIEIQRCLHRLILIEIIQKQIQKRKAPRTFQGILVLHAKRFETKWKALGRYTSCNFFVMVSEPQCEPYQVSCQTAELIINPSNRLQNSCSIFPFRRISVHVLVEYSFSCFPILSNTVSWRDYSGQRDH